MIGFLMVVLAQVPDFDRRCGNPMLESMGWTVVAATVLSASGDHSIRVRIGERDVTVHPPGVAGVNPAFGAYITQNVAGKRVEIAINPSRWPNEGKHPKHVDGMVTVERQGDLGLLLIQSGVARFVRPKPYTLSGYKSCLYQLADRSR